MIKNELRKNIDPRRYSLQRKRPLRMDIKLTIVFNIYKCKTGKEFDMKSSIIFIKLFNHTKFFCDVIGLFVCINKFSHTR